MKNLLALFSLITLIGFSSKVYSQSQTNNAAEKPYIEVTGTADAEIIPDEIYVGITIRERIVNKEKLTIEAQEEKLKNALKEIGVDVAKNLSVSDLNADFYRIRLRKKDVYAQKDYSLKVADATTLGKVFQKLDEVDILDARITKVDHSKMDSIRKSVKILAIRNAKEKADYLLQAIGEQSGKPLIIREQELDDLNAFRGNIAARGISGKGGRYNENVYYVDGIAMPGHPKLDEVEFKKIKVQTTIYVKFGIK